MTNYKNIDEVIKYSFRYNIADLKEESEYKSNVKFYDDDKVTHLQFDYLIKIVKEWD